MKKTYRNYIYQYEIPGHLVDYFIDVLNRSYWDYALIKWNENFVTIAANFEEGIYQLMEERARSMWQNAYSWVPLVISDKELEQEGLKEALMDLYGVTEYTNSSDVLMPSKEECKSKYSRAALASLCRHNHLAAYELWENRQKQEAKRQQLYKEYGFTNCIKPESPEPEVTEKLYQYDVEPVIFDYVKNIMIRSYKTFRVIPNDSINILIETNANLGEWWAIRVRACERYLTDHLYGHPLVISNSELVVNKGFITALKNVRHRRDYLADHSHIYFDVNLQQRIDDSVEHLYEKCHTLDEIILNIRGELDTIRTDETAFDDMQIEEYRLRFSRVPYIDPETKEERHISEEAVEQLHLCGLDYIAELHRFEISSYSDKEKGSSTKVVHKRAIWGLKGFEKGTRQAEELIAFMSCNGFKVCDGPLIKS